MRKGVCACRQENRCKFHRGEGGSFLSRGNVETCIKKNTKMKNVCKSRKMKLSLTGRGSR